MPAGPDDYLVKPFVFHELLPQVRGFTKRYAETSTPQRQYLADLELNLDSKIVTRAGPRIDPGNGRASTPVMLLGGWYALKSGCLRCHIRVGRREDGCRSYWCRRGGGGGGGLEPGGAEGS